MKPLRCMLNHHHWSRTLDDIPKDAIFARIDCTRKGCDYSMDAVPLLRLRDEDPALWNRVKSRMP